MRIPVSLFGVFVMLAACDSGTDTKGAKGKADKIDKAKPTGPIAKFDPKDDAKDDAKDDVEADEADEAGDEPVDPAEEFAASREDKVVEVTAEPGTPEWFVQGLAAFRAGNIDPIVANFAKNITWDAVGSPLEPPSKGSEAVRSRWEDLLTGIPDMKLHARRIFHQGDLVVMQVVLTGSHKGDFRGLAPTNKPLGAEVLAWVWHDKEGKAKKVLVYYNEAALLAQMGVLGEGAPVPPIPEIPTGDPEIITGEDDAAAKKAIKELYAAGKDSWKVCEEKLCVEGVVGHDMAEGKTMKTPEEHKASQEMFFAAFPDLKPKLEQTVALGPDWVVATMRGKATHKGDLGPLKATNKKVNLAYSELVRLEEGKIAETWGYWNNLDLLAQLGVFTPPKEAKSSTPYEGPPKVEDPDEEKAAEEGEGEAKDEDAKAKKGKKAKGADEAKDEKADKPKKKKGDEEPS
jgi:predicted ester cyclase